MPSIHGILVIRKLPSMLVGPGIAPLNKPKRSEPSAKPGGTEWPAGPHLIERQGDRELLGGTGRIGKQIIVIALLEGPAPAEKFHEHGTASRGGDARNDSEALGCVGIKGIDCNGGLVEREGLLAISHVLVAPCKIVEGE